MRTGISLLPPSCGSAVDNWHFGRTLTRNYASKAKKGKKDKKQKGGALQGEDDTEEDEELAVSVSAKGKKGGKGGKAKEANPAEPSGALEDVTGGTREQMDAALDALNRELSKLRTGRASPGMLDHVMVEAYGVPTPLNRVASVTVRDAQMLGVTLHDPNLVSAVEKGIALSPMGLNPSTEGTSISVPIPRLTQEVRQAMAKLVIKAGETAKVSLRRARKEGLDSVKVATDGGSEDVAKRLEKEIQDLTNKYTKQVEDSCKAKEKEVMTG